MDNVDDNMVSFNWKFIGHGHRVDREQEVVIYHTTLQQCLAFCTKKRQDSGPMWNGVYWLRDYEGGRAPAMKTKLGIKEMQDIFILKYNTVSYSYFVKHVSFTVIV